MQVEIEQIKVGARMRRDLGDIEELAASLSRIGLLNPIVLDRQNILLAGCRRLEAAKSLGWSEIECTYIDDCDPALAKEIELEENLRRKDFTWVEEVQGLEQVVDLKQARYGRATRGKQGAFNEGAYSQKDAAAELERSTSSVSMDLTLARALREYPQIALEPTKASAFKRYRLLYETALREQLARGSRADHPAENKKFEEWQREREGQPEAPRQLIVKTIFKERQSVIYHADSRDVLKFFSDKGIRVDCIVTDPPYGLNMHKEGKAVAGSRLAENVGDMYDDDPHAVMDMLDEVFMWAGQVLKPDGHAYVFFHMVHYEQMFLMLRKHFGEVDETPIIWAKNTPGIGDPNRTWVYAYEPCFFVNRGRMLIKPQAFNYLKYDTIPPGQKIHPTEKPSALLRNLITASCVSGELVLDPFSGSGSTLVAADQVNCKFIGIERHEGFYRASVERLSERIADHQEAAQAPAVASSDVA